MAGPIPLPTAPHPDQLAIELAAVKRTLGGLRDRIEEAIRQIMGAYIVYAGSLDRPLPERFRGAFAAAVSRILAGIQAEIRQPLWEMLWRSLLAGQQIAISYLADAATQQLNLYGSAAYHQAVDTILGSVLAYNEPTAVTAQWAGDVVHAAQTNLWAQLLSAREAPHVLLPPEPNWSDVQAMLGPLQKAAGDLERNTRWAVNAAFNQASRDIADAHNVGRMWIAERDACLHCLALSGQIAQPGQPFDGGLTFYVGKLGGLKPLLVYGGVLWGPPRHPNCRCHQVPVPVLQDYPVMPWEQAPYHPAQALQREAQRAVLRGDSGSESLPARLRAVQALLDRGVSLPVTVQRRARRAVRRRQFENRRWDRVH